MIVHELGGCSPTPLAHYLKALGVLRLVAEQADAGARGWWEGERFFLATVLDKEELLRFFLDQYRPTPLLAPWNGGSGFFRTWDAKAKKLRNSKNLRALESLLSQKSERWNSFRDAYQTALIAVSAVLKETNVDELSDKERRELLIVPKGSGPVFPVADKDHDKENIQKTMVRWCAANTFYRACIVDASKKIAYPSLWASGGNDGNIDFTARHFENLEITLLTESSSRSLSWLDSAIFGGLTHGVLSGTKGKVGQFLPAGAGGANSVSGFGSQHDTQLNPWDFVLMMEGAVALTASTTRRLGSRQSPGAAAPFAIGGQGAAYASAADTDESPSGEQWMPLWGGPLTYSELRRLLAEGRAQLGAKPVQEPLDMARAIARHGAARGISEFQRYGYIERNGQSNLAVPLGRFRVPDQVSPRLACLDDLDAWFVRLRRAARDKGAPARLKMSERRLADALFSIVQHPDEAQRWQAVLVGLAGVEAILATGTGYKAGPVPPLRAEWVTVADDGAVEFRLAVACALQAGSAHRGTRPGVGGVRRHWLPLAEKNGRRRFATSGTAGQARLSPGSDVVMHGRSGIEDAIALVRRRLIESAQRGERSLPLFAAVNAAVTPADLAQLVRGAVDLDRTMTLARALMALDARGWARNPFPPRSDKSDERPDDAWLVLRLSLLSWPLEDGRRIPLDTAIFRRLESGDAATALELARRRLQAAGIQSSVRVTSVPADTARCWAAAMAFPISRRTASRFVHLIDPHALSEAHHAA